MVPLSTGVATRLVGAAGSVVQSMLDGGESPASVWLWERGQIVGFECLATRAAQALVFLLFQDDVTLAVDFQARFHEHRLALIEAVAVTDPLDDDFPSFQGR